jgi:hypothetical protein
MYMKMLPTMLGSIEENEASTDGRSRIRRAPAWQARSGSGEYFVSADGQGAVPCDRVRELRHFG